jgi:D-serine deaminase-like pyridoxal phosphate-dependent protein
VQAGAQGICVAKLSEAEVMLAGGVDDVLITTELAGPIKAQRLKALVDRHPYASVRIVVDSFEGASAIDAALARPVSALIEVNVAQNRAGVAPEQAIDLAERLAQLPNINLIGLQGYEGNLQHVRDPQERQYRSDEAMQRLQIALKALQNGSHDIITVTTGGTGTAEFCAAHDFVTEVQPGSFIFMDADYLDTNTVPYKSALTALTTVISHPSPDRVVVDAGLKTLSNDSGPARLKDALGWSYHHAGDEHGVLTSDGNAPPRDLDIGDRLALIPSHIDTTVNLHDVIHAHRDGAIEQTWSIAARGKVQ